MKSRPCLSASFAPSSHALGLDLSGGRLESLVAWIGAQDVVLLDVEDAAVRSSGRLGI